MTKATFQSLTAREQALIAETRNDRLRTLDEDALIGLLNRVRRARDKHVQLHRREVGQHVDETRARGVASAAPRRSASKAEVFEQALARVSTSLARAARANAAALRAERLNASRRPKAAAKHAAPVPKGDDRNASGRERRRTPIERKAAASRRAEGARRQAKRDAR